MYVSCGAQGPMLVVWGRGWGWGRSAYRDLHRVALESGATDDVFPLLGAS
jgi:hypothetical protein